MQKIEIILEGTEAEKCAKLINDLATAVIKHYDVVATSIYCGHAAVKKGFSELPIPSFVIQATKAKGKPSGKNGKKK